MNDGERLPTPIWLTDIDYPAPCPCGEPMMEGEPMMLVVNSENGLQRVLHQRCAVAMMADEDE